MMQKHQIKCFDLEQAHSDYGENQNNKVQQSPCLSSQTDITLDLFSSMRSDKNNFFHAVKLFNQKAQFSVNKSEQIQNQLFQWFNQKKIRVADPSQILQEYQNKKKKEVTRITKFKEVKSYSNLVLESMQLQGKCDLLNRRQRKSMSIIF